MKFIILNFLIFRSFLDGIIRSSLESGVPLSDEKSSKEAKNMAPENMSNKALLEQLCRNSRLTPLPKPILTDASSSGDESYRKSSSPLNFSTGKLQILYRNKESILKPAIFRSKQLQPPGRLEASIVASIQQGDQLGDDDRARGRAVQRLHRLGDNARPETKQGRGRRRARTETAENLSESRLG